MLELTKDEVEALGYALDLAYDDQANYINVSNLAVDYGTDWPDAREHKVTSFMHIAAIAEKLEMHGEPERWRALASQVHEITLSGAVEEDEGWYEDFEEEDDYVED
jgi:hypothetical protein